MSIPQASDNYIVVGPGRTGSKLIVDSITVIRRQLGMSTVKRDPTHNDSIFESSTVYHSHRVKYLGNSHLVSKCIMSIRDLVDSALSWCIKPYIGEWHLYPIKHSELIVQLEASIPTFYLEPKIFLYHYEAARVFYQLAGQYDLSGVLIIDYGSFQYDTMRIVRELGYPLIPLRGIPRKNPGTYREWISNWDEIELVIRDLERDPLMFIQKR